MSIKRRRAAFTCFVSPAARTVLGTNCAANKCRRKRIFGGATLSQLPALAFKKPMFIESSQPRCELITPILQVKELTWREIEASKRQGRDQSHLPPGPTSSPRRALPPRQQAFLPPCPQTDYRPGTRVSYILERGPPASWGWSVLEGKDPCDFHIFIPECLAQRRALCSECKRHTGRRGLESMRASRPQTGVRVHTVAPEPHSVS